MIIIRRSAERGHADHGWLDTRHTFSFAGYHDPEFAGCGDLRVLNQDRVRPGRGFASHGHTDMEIVTWVLEGVLEHKDDMGNVFQLRPGDLQVMSAGTGVTHSEYNASGTETLHFLQMWIEPAETGTTPHYRQRAFPLEERRGRMRLLVSPSGQADSLSIGQDARLYAGNFEPGEESAVRLDPDRRAWVHVARGRVRVCGEQLVEGDGAAISSEKVVVIEGMSVSELLLWDLA